MNPTLNRDNAIRSVRLSPYRPGTGPRFTLTLWDTYARDGLGKSRLAYRLNMHAPNIRHSGRTVTLFEGADFCCSPMDAIDSDATVAAILGFLTLRPGDTDAEYFDDYTDAQREYCTQHAEALSCEAMNRFELRNL